MEKQGLPIQLKTAHVKKLLGIFHPDKDQNNPYLIRELDEETARQYVYPELIWRVTEFLCPKLRPFFPTLQQEFLESYISCQYAHDKVKAKIQEYFEADFLTYVDISKENARQITNQILKNTDINGLAKTIGGELQDQAILDRWLRQKRGIIF